MQPNASPIIVSAPAETTEDLELVSYGNGYAWLRTERRFVLPSRYQLTDAGRRALALERLFGPWPNVAEARNQPCK